MRKIRESHFSKIVAYYLLVNLIVELIAPTAAYALTSGPKQPEFTSFTPIATSDMVDLSSGDFNYNIPIMDVGGYPINLAYNSGVTMDQEASWVGLGWNLNVGQIERQVRGLPDDFNGDLMNYQNDMRENKTIGANFNVSPALLGNNFPFSMGLGVDYNNYVGLSFKPSIGMSFKMGMDSSVGFTLSGSTEGGANLGLDAKYKSRNEKTTANISANLSSRQGLQNISASCFNSDMMLKGGGNFAVFARNTLNRNGYGTASLSLNNTHNYTPTKRVSYINNNKTYNATIGGEVIGIEGELRISGYGSFQNIHEKDKTVSGFGYDNTHLKGNREGVLDFNRENETTINKNSTVLPLTNYTYDTFSIQGQGISGMFRPHHTQVGYLFNDVTIDQSSSQSFGIEIGSGQTVHIGVDFQNSPTESVTGPWYTHNHALGRFTEHGKMGLLQNISYRMVGELGVDTDKNYINGFEGSSPMKLGISGEWGNRKLESRYDVKKLDYYKYSTSVNNNPISRAKRELKNQVVQKIQNSKADGKFIFKNNAPGHHTAGIKIIKTDGSSYIYGKAAYNNTKIEASFDVSGLNGNVVDSDKELVTYTDSRNSGNSDSDHFYNKTTTPKYAHSYLITSVLSPDYQDIDNNGPSDMDLGNYTKFEYSVPKTYNWRVPTQIKTASYSAGVKSNPNDQKGHYLYGSKELVYLNKIVTKTHIAVFELKDRKDALGVTGEDGGADTSQRMKYISKIMLYAKEDYLKNGSNALPIKTAHFEYDYSLCPNVPSNSGEDEIINTININKAKGKLTLKKIYFTYRNSLMGKYTPYAFEYANNQAYNMKSFDVWNNFKDKSVNPSGISNTEYPYVFQDKATADKNTSTWVLKRIKLPSGGEINIETESDDYKYVQNKKAMQMFQISGVGYTNSPTEDQILYDMLGKGHIKYIYVKIPNANLSAVEFRKKYLSENLSEPIFFNAHVDLVNGDYEPIKGYFLINTDKLNEMTVNSNGIVAIPLRSVKRDGGIGGSSHVNPISKTAWGFGRQNINRRMYQMEGDATTKSFIAACKELVNSIAMMAEIISGPNGMLEMKGRANKIDTSKSWVRLENPSGVKFGGGLRVKSIQLSDNWDVMNSEIDNPIYKEMYGQNYSYSLNDGTSSSGVATFEPNGSQENPFKKPFYSYEDQSYADRISQPAENNYVELPFGESFFPSPKVTYSRVTVANLAKQDSSVPNKVVKKHATGQVVSCFYTSLDFPTKTDFTNIDPWVDTTEDSLLSAFLPKIYSYNSLTFSQGFSVETNDMDGKPKSRSVYAEGVTNDQNFISKEEYIYSLDSNYGLNNDVTTIDENGNVSTNTIGVTRDLVNDFNESQSITKTFGTHVNLAIFIIGIFPITISMPIPNMQYQKNRMRTATTTKVTHRMGLLSEKIVYDNNSKVSTKNLAWDAKTGEVLLTQTSNEFEDNYYSFNYPAYWYYASMGLASENIDFECSLTKSSSSNKFVILNPGQQNITQIFKIGDELQLNDFTKYWVIKVASDGIQLMDKDGNDLDPKITGNFNVRIVNSGNKNLQSSNMATVTAMINPLDKLIGGKIINPFSYLPTDTNKPKVINASAIEYSDDWKSQCENNLPNEFGLLNGQGKPVNPYLYNIKGQWKPIRSYAYLSSRINQEESNRRNKGHFKDYNAFYKIDNVTGKWLMDKQNWTFASAITKYNPYGVEVENKDALNRYSAAQYGYHYKLPVAVGSNTKYQEIGADNFEDYYDDLNPTIYRPHFNFSQGLINNTIFVTDKKSHSGVKSLVVKPGNRATYKRKIEPCKNN